MEPKRIEYARCGIERLGYDVICNEKELTFTFNGSVVHFWPYSGYFNGKSVISGRGLNNLLKQIKPNV